jgi:hypothetical protein
MAVQAILAGLMAAQGLMSMFSGLRANKSAGVGIAPLFARLSGQGEQQAAQEEARLLGVQSDLAYSESLRDAAQRRREVEKFTEQQSLDFSSSGVTLQGSPLGVLEETRFLGQQEVDSIKRRGEAMSGLLSAQGLQMLRRGSSAAFGGFANALQMRFTNSAQGLALGQQGFQTGLSGFGAALQGISLLRGGSTKTTYGAAPKAAPKPGIGAMGDFGFTTTPTA